MHNPESVLENEILWDFKIQTIHLILARQPDLVIVNKERELAKSWTLLFLLPQCKTEGNRKVRSVPRPCKSTDKIWNTKVTLIPIVIGVLGFSHQRIGTGTEGLGNQRTSGDHPMY